MPRTAGARNSDYELARDRLLDAVIPRLTVAVADRPSFRELADHAQVSVSTLRHYFADREGLVIAAFTRMHDLGREHMEASVLLASLPAEEALRAYCENLLLAWQSFGVGAMLSTALAEGMNQPRLGPAYVQELLEPMIQGCEALLGGLVEAGSLPPLDTRLGAIQLISPLFVALLHQDTLGGVACRPLDLGAFAPAHVRAFLAGHGGVTQASLDVAQAGSTRSSTPVSPNEV
jgi:AcrR family transcriptional regulator